MAGVAAMGAVGTGAYALASKRCDVRGDKNEKRYQFVIASQAPGPDVIKCFPCSTQLSMKFFLLINVKMPTSVGILSFMNRKNSIIGLSDPERS